jgi:uncharacterized membrane protein YagU involved in acid resistance
MHHASRNKWIVGAIGGLLGGIVYALWEMMVEGIRSASAGGSFWGSLSTHTGFWSPPQWIGATLIRTLQSSRNPNFDLGALILGMMGHLMNSIIFGLIFVALAYYLTRSVGGLLALGMMYGAALFTIMWLLVVPTVDPAMQEVNGVLFLVGHLLYGGVLGLVAGVRAERAEATRRQFVPA